MNVWSFYCQVTESLTRVPPNLPDISPPLVVSTGMGTEVSPRRGVLFLNATAAAESESSAAVGKMLSLVYIA